MRFPWVRKLGVPGPASQTLSFQPGGPGARCPLRIFLGEFERVVKAIDRVEAFTIERERSWRRIAQEIETAPFVMASCWTILATIPC